MIFLSYFLSNDTPLYGNGNGIEILPDKEIITGDSCNTMNISFPNHSGTHIDLPCHFNSKGRALNDYPPDYWEFNKIEIFNFSDEVNDSQIIGSDFFQNIKNYDAEIILIKTGYGKFRGTNRYTLTPPGISAELAPFLRENFKNLRCIGMDLISVSSFSNREEGRKAHHAFLNPKVGEPILLIEDMKLDIFGNFKKIIVSPLLVDKIDGTPCTVFAYN